MMFYPGSFMFSYGKSRGGMMKGGLTMTGTIILVEVLEFVFTRLQQLFNLVD